MTDGGNPETNIKIAFPGVETVVDIGPRTGVVAATMVEQTKQRATIRSCRACEVAPGIVPSDPTYPILNHRFVIVGQLMTREQGKWWQTAFRNAGWRDQGTWEAVATVTYPACAEDRRPTSEMLRECKGHAHDSIWHANTDYVLLVGGAAKDLWRPDLTVDQMVGKVGVMWDRYIAMVVPSPVAVMSMPGGKKKEAKNAAVLAALRTWKEVVQGSVRSGEADNEDEPFILPPTAYMARECVGDGCRRAVARMDRDGIGWCARCWEAGGKVGWRFARGVRVDGQMEMF